MKLVGVKKLRERAKWIEEYGSEHLRALALRGYGSEELYQRERVAHALTQFGGLPFGTGDFILLETAPARLVSPTPGELLCQMDWEAFLKRKPGDGLYLAEDKRGRNWNDEATVLVVLEPNLLFAASPPVGFRIPVTL